MAEIASAALLADPALRAVLAALPEARLVGGCVRDTLAGQPVTDIDLATPRPPAQVLAALAEAGLRAAPTGLAHGTVTALSGGRGFEVTTLRRDLRTDGRHAEVAFTDDWREDAARRDFTFNALSLSQDGVLFDYFGGRADLAARRVRFVGDPATRLAEDRLRVLRFFRFFARFGGPPPDAATLAALRSAATQLGMLSAERVWAELKRLLASADPRQALALMDELGVLRALLPRAGGIPRLARMIAAGAPNDALLRLAALLDGPMEAAVSVAVAARLRLSGAEAARLAALRAPPVPRDGDDDPALRRLLAGTPRDVLIGRVWLSEGPAALRARLNALPAPAFALLGRDALDLGVPPGPAVGAALARVRAWWLDGGCTADRAACLARLEQEAGLRA
jgi:poly(A) polymerase/tRNA nucleotidyltransferase (CCA-adding enzyme)